MDYEAKRDEFREEVLTITEAAEILGTTRQNMHLLISNGVYLPFKYLPNGKAKKGIALLLRDEVLDTEKEKNYNKRREYEKEVLLASETADMLGLTRQRIHGLIKNGTYTPFKYIKQGNGSMGIPLLLKSEILDIEKKKLDTRRAFEEEYITTALAKKIMRKRLPDFIRDLDTGIIKMRGGIKGLTGVGSGYINLNEFAGYAGNFGINLNNLITSDAVAYRLTDNGICIPVYEFLRKYNIKSVYVLKDLRYALFRKDIIDEAIKEEIK